MGQYYEDDLLDSALTSNTVNKNDEQNNANTVGGVLVNTPGGTLGNNPNNVLGNVQRNPIWIMSCAGMILFAIVVIAIINKRHQMLAMETASGNMVTKGRKVNKKQVVAAIKRKEETPRETMFSEIVESIESAAQKSNRKE